MKRIKLLVTALIVAFISCINVYAYEPFLSEVAPSLNQNMGAINTFEHYTYDMNQIYKQGEELYFYSVIKNNSEKKRFISVEVLLFDKDEKNIGVFNYCSGKDYESELSKYEMKAGENVTLNKKITDKYLANPTKNTLNDIASYAFIKENEFCKIGGYKNYYGKTFNEITGSLDKVESGTKFDALISTINRYVPIDGLNLGLGVGVIIAIVVFVIFLAIWVAFGAFLNKLHRAMYGRTTALAYVPIANSYLCVKMAFGKIVGLSYLGVSLLGGLLTLIGFGFVVAIANLAIMVAFILDIVKLVTGKYDLCYLDNTNNNVIVDNFNNANNAQGFNNNQPMQNQQMQNQPMGNQTNAYGYSQDNNVKESMIGVSTNKSLDDDKNNDNMNSNNQNNNNQNNDDNSGDSDLSRFFR